MCPPARLFLNRMLDTFRQCPEQGSFTFSPEFCKNLDWFDRFLPTTNGTFLIHQVDRHPVQLYFNTCMSAAKPLQLAEPITLPSHLGYSGTTPSSATSRLSMPHWPSSCGPHSLRTNSSTCSATTRPLSPSLRPAGARMPSSRLEPEIYGRRACSGTSPSQLATYRVSTSRRLPIPYPIPPGPNLLGQGLFSNLR